MENFYAISQMNLIYFKESYQKINKFFLNIWKYKLFVALSFK